MCILTCLCLTQALPCPAPRLPRQKQVDPEEYREFLNLGLGDIFLLDIDRVLDRDRKWLDPDVRGTLQRALPLEGSAAPPALTTQFGTLQADITDYFNYEFTPDTWREYCDSVRRFQVESAHGQTIITFERGNGLHPKGKSLQLLPVHRLEPRCWLPVKRISSSAAGASLHRMVSLCSL